MKLFKKSTYPEYFKCSISIFIIFFLINNLIAIGSENKSDFLRSNNIDKELKEAFFNNAIPYNEYDNTQNQIEIFFGRWRNPQRSENIFYPDLSIINNSVHLREIYKSKLNDMIWK